ncbi:MAG: DMT family transporter [Proteobacteria bacterium]|nr:DMT family transporter [Pseudomonadota bacterium]
MSAYIAVLVSSFLWAIATQFYAKIVDKITVFRFNMYKSIFAFVCFFISALFIGRILPPPGTLGWLLLSGFLGFALADLFIFYSFSKNGPARTLMLSAFEPSIIAVYSYFILHKTLSWNKTIGLLFLILCLVFMALERHRRGTVSIKVALLALIGINIEALGVVFTKKAFMVAPEMSSMTANLYRVIPALFLLGILNYFKGVKFGITDLSVKMKSSIIFSAFIGTFLALYFYLYAISKIGHPSIIAALGSLAPFYASIYEHWRDKKLPNKYFMLSLCSMIIGLFILLYN